jgi:hypothetical protein
MMDQLWGQTFCTIYLCIWDGRHMEFQRGQMPSQVVFSSCSHVIFTSCTKAAIIIMDIDSMKLQRHDDDYLIR